MDFVGWISGHHFHSFLNTLAKMGLLFPFGTLIVRCFSEIWNFGNSKNEISNLGVSFFMKLRFESLEISKSRFVVSIF